MNTWKNHDLVDLSTFNEILYEERPVLLPDGSPAPGLHNVWIIINNPAQLNSYTTGMVKEIILAFRKASNDRHAVAVVFTGAGDRAFCTGGNTKEYAEYYAGQPGEYRQYMRLFNDMVTAILHCDKPVICRANGMRIGGGQEIGMACDFTIAQDLARFGQAGPKHGSAPDGGSTDFLALFVGVERAMFSCTVCEPWSAHKALDIGLITDLVPALQVNGEWVPNPLVHTHFMVDDHGRQQYGAMKSGAGLAEGKALLKKGTVDLTLLDQAVDALATDLLMTMPDCLTKTIESVRKHKLAHWDKNRETNRAWLSLNMMNEANAGFRAFNQGDKDGREVDFPALRKRLGDGERWSEELIQQVIPGSKVAR